MSILRLSMSSAFLVFASAIASAQAGGFAYDRLGTLHGGIQCLTWDDENFETWTLTNTTPGQVPLNVEVRIIGIATFGVDPNCAAADGFLQVSQVLMPNDNPGTDFCIGDGGDQMGCTPCPCGNEDLSAAGGGCQNSAGDSALLQAEGTGSLSAQDLCFRMRGAVAGSFGVLFSGTAAAPNNPANPCFAQNPGSGVTSVSFDGLRCAVQATQRHGGRPVDVNGEVGALTNPWGFCSAGFPGNSIFAAGQTRYFQTIYRDFEMAVCMTGLNTTQGVSLTFVP